MLPSFHAYVSKCTKLYTAVRENIYKTRNRPISLLMQELLFPSFLPERPHDVIGLLREEQGGAKVGKLNRATSVGEHIRRFHVAMRDSSRVQVPTY